MKLPETVQPTATLAQTETIVSSDSRQAAIKGVSLGLATVMLAGGAIFLKESPLSPFAPSICAGASPESLQAVGQDVAAAEKEVGNMTYLGTNAIDSPPLTSPSATRFYGIANSGLSGKQIFDKTAGFLSKYGVDLSLVTEPDSPQQRFKTSPATLADLETATAKQDMAILALGISRLPVEFVQGAGVKHFKLASKITGAEAYALTGGDHDTVIFSLEAPESSDGVLTDDASLNEAVVLHEISHEDDVVVCGSTEAAANDPSFTASNNGIRYIDDLEGVEKINEMNSYPASLAALDRMDKERRTQPGATLKCSDIQKLEDAVVMSDDYNYTSVKEDKAVVEQEVLTGSTSLAKVLDPKFPRLRSKAIQILARIRDQLPPLYDNLINDYQLYEQQKIQHVVMGPNVDCLDS